MMGQIRTHQYKPNHMLIAGEFPQDGGARFIKRELNHLQKRGNINPLLLHPVCPLDLYLIKTNAFSDLFYLHAHESNQGFRDIP